MKIYPLLNKTFASAGLFSLLCYSSISHAAVSQQPLMLVESVAPNLIFTLDSSGSMNWGFAPDSMGVDDSDLRNTRRVKSSAFNPLYYNPDVTYRPPVKLNSDGTVADPGYTTSFNKAWHNGYQTGRGHDDLSSKYRVTWNWYIDASQSYDYDSYTNYAAPTGHVYNLAQNPSADFTSSNIRKGVPAYYYVFDVSQCSSSQNKTIDNDDCYRKVDVGTEQNGEWHKENFANWYSFYRTRALATLTAANLAFNDLPSSIRFTWQHLGDNCRLNRSDSSCRNNQFRSFTDQHKGNFFSWLAGVSFSTGTPLREAMDKAGKFLQTDTAWAFNPNPITGGNTVRQPEYACRPSFHVMMSDGMWNGSDGSPSGTFRHDNATFNLPGIGSYTRQRPYADSTSNTLADLAMHYWATDLSSLDNEVKPFMPFKGSNENWDPRNNPATWQHMVNYTMGLGLSRALDATGLPWAGDTFSGGYENLLNGSRNWPAASDSSDNNVYDLWHAAINSRGEFFSVERPEDMIQAFNDIINRIAERTATAAAAGATTSVSANDPNDSFDFNTENRAFFPEYNSEDWSGDIKHAVITRSPNGSFTREQKWSARTAMDQQSNRNIYMGGGSGASGLVDFSYSNLSSDLKNIFNRNPDSLGNATDNRGADRVAYLRGNRQHEGNADNQFRRRSSVLGDIINATPVVVGGAQYVPYVADKIDGSPGDYKNFQDSLEQRPELIYVGANDGMLHALSTSDGHEVFAFTPQALLRHMPRLTGQSYKGGGHRFYVDGTPVVRDVYISGEWRTILIGTLRAGGKSIFALDITNPGTDGGGVKLLWEISEATEGYENLGYSFPEPEVVRLHSGEWAVLQGNGYESDNGVASLFIINIADGELIKELVVEEDTHANGLSSVRGADNNGDGLVDYAYAGDLQGNLWRFDLVKTTNQDIVGDPFSPDNQGNVTATDYKISYSGNPLYKARYSNGHIQPITAPPSLVRHPTRRGYLVLIGTGKYFETDDAAPDKTKAHSIYAIWDRQTRAQSAGHPSNLARSNLQQQAVEVQKMTTFSDDDGGSVTWELRYLSDNDVEWYPEGTLAEDESDNSNVQNWGWFVDLEVNNDKQGEMMIQRMSAQGDTLLFGTLTPNADPCADGANYWAYAINAHTGGRTKHPTFDFNRDGRHDRLDTDSGKAPSGYITSSPITLTSDGSVIDVGTSVGFRPARLHGRETWQSMPLEVEE